MDLSPIANAAVTAAAAAVAALAGLLIPMLPRLFIWLKVSINGADNTLLRAAIANAAQRAVQEIDAGTATEVAIGGMADYVRANLPAAIARLKVPLQTLLTMCAAELARVQARRV